MKSGHFIPVAEPEIGDAERRNVLDCLDSGWVSSDGPYVAKLEDGLARRVGRRHGIALASGTAALDASFVALDLEPGDEVILPTFTIISCAAAIVRAGGIPVTVDCDPLSWTMRADEVAAKITQRTRAILIVHIYGLPVDADPILALAERHGLFVVEDAAQAIGQRYRDRPCGAIGQMSATSFYANKNITTGEGGMVLTDDDALAARCRSMRNLYFAGPRRFRHESLGWNWRMSNLQAALGCGQLESLDATCARKRTNGQRYEERLRDQSALQLPVMATDYAENDFWVFGVIIADDVPMDNQQLIQRLAAEGVGARPFFWPMHEQPALHKLGLLTGNEHPCAERIARRGLYLPSSARLTEDDIDRVCETLGSILATPGGETAMRSPLRPEA